MSSFELMHIRGRPAPKKKVCNFVGGVVSPILSNLYMDRFDRFVEHTLIPENTRGTKREGDVIYKRLRGLGWYYRKQGNLERADALRKEAQQHPSGDPNDPN